MPRYPLKFFKRHNAMGGLKGMSYRELKSNIKTLGNFRSRILGSQSEQKRLWKWVPKPDFAFVRNLLDAILVPERK